MKGPEFDSVCLCKAAGCPWCFPLNEAQKDAGKVKTMRDIFRTKFKNKKS